MQNNPCKNRNDIAILYLSIGRTSNCENTMSIDIVYRFQIYDMRWILTFQNYCTFHICSSFFLIMGISTKSILKMILHLLVIMQWNYVHTELCLLQRCKFWPNLHVKCCCLATENIYISIKMINYKGFDALKLANQLILLEFPFLLVLSGNDYEVHGLRKILI
jgi:hypothetical protein